jgi:Zn-dependent protease with chaperone function
MPVREWRMSEVSRETPRLVLIALLCVFGANLISAQPSIRPLVIPPTFQADTVFAARVRSLLLPYSKPATGQFEVGERVLQTLLRQVPAERAKFSWELRIAKGAGNAFSSPDGTIYVDEDLATIWESRAGLWAAALSHEISHTIRRDWARRYLFQKALEESGASQITLDGTGAFSGSWVDPQGASTELARFCQTMEFEADAEGLMLMTRAGFDPDFLPALHHLMAARPGQEHGNSLDPSHPGWDERDERLQKIYVAAGREYDRLWPDRYAAPGGNSPVVVYAGLPNAKRGADGELEVVIPLRCQNLIGSVEVVLRFTDPNSGLLREQRQVTGCTSNRTFISFLVPNPNLRKRSSLRAEVSVFDDSGSLLTRALAPLAGR